MEDMVVDQFLQGMDYRELRVQVTANGCNRLEHGISMTAMLCIAWSLETVHNEEELTLKDASLVVRLASSQTGMPALVSQRAG